MNTPLAAAIHKENVHGEKATVTMKPDKLKTAKTAGKKRKASADLRGTYIPVAGASKDVDLKKKSAMKGNKIKKNQMTQGKQHAAATDRTTKKHHIFTDEEIKQGHELDEYEIEEVGKEDDWRQLFVMKSTIPGMISSLMGVPISELEQPFLSDEEGYKTDDYDFDSSKLVPGPLYTLEELDDHVDKVRKMLKEYPFPELKPDDD